MNRCDLSRQALKRLPLYLEYLRSYVSDKPGNISATAIADALGLHQVQVRKDLALVTSGGRPRTGYSAHTLTEKLEHFLGYNKMKYAVLVGAGHLGGALLCYDGFKSYGLEIAAAFDIDPELIGRTSKGKEIFEIEHINEVCRRCKAQIGIIAVPANAAQSVCDRLVQAGIHAILNFAPAHLKTPENVFVQDENMAVSLAILSVYISNLQ